MSRCRPTHGGADPALLQRGLRVLAIAQRGKHDLRAGCRRREDRVESGVASGTGNRLPLGVTRRKNERPAGFEPATRCLEGTFEPSQDVAWRRSTSHLAAIIVAYCRRESRGVGLHWLPNWLPKI